MEGEGGEFEVGVKLSGEVLAVGIRYPTQPVELTVLLNTDCFITHMFTASQVQWLRHDQLHSRVSALQVNAKPPSAR
ncbi:hypothetical protein GCM10007235_08830 [Pseudoxanthomonas indica]|nr:hypothetical protein GCM10007235_08830 [Pseudoxanthomonas indica]